MRTLENYSTVVILDRDDISATLMELVLLRVGFGGRIVKINSTADVAVMAEVERPVLFIADFFTNYLDNFNDFAVYHEMADRVLVLGEFEEELKRFEKRYTHLPFFKKPLTIELVKSWFLDV